jgi:hypothetical protein
MIRFLINLIRPPPRCPDCGVVIRANANFCSQCGLDIKTRVCRYCGSWKLKRGSTSDYPFGEDGRADARWCFCPICGLKDSGVKIRNGER